MKALCQIIVFSIIFVTAAPVRAESPHPLLASVLREVYLEEADCDSTLDFLRTKGTEELRKLTGNASAILIFEYGFTPQRAKHANFRKSNVQFGEVLLNVLPQLGISYKVVGLDRIILVDATEKDKKR